MDSECWILELIIVRFKHLYTGNCLAPTGFICSTFNIRYVQTHNLYLNTTASLSGMTLVYFFFFFYNTAVSRKSDLRVSSSRNKFKPGTRKIQTSWFSINDHRYEGMTLRIISNCRWVTGAKYDKGNEVDQEIKCMMWRCLSEVTHQVNWHPVWWLTTTRRVRGEAVNTVNDSRGGRNRGNSPETAGTHTHTDTHSLICGSEVCDDQSKASASRRRRRRKGGRGVLN